ncbi:MAG: hypothetical protein AB1711_06255 [Thermodesulfobacteriota bacterium]
MSDSNREEHIRNIRYDFQASQRVKDSLNNSVQALARDLYSKDTHFIFELIQNAEDNSYEAVEPSLSFRLGKCDPTGTQGSDGVLIVQNNEIGFSLDNVDAICAVGKTTKRKIQGYIGEKGIGFKSVFRVTSNPHIFSNGYSFCLPEYDEETGLGYIVPQWVVRVPEGINPSHTTIILPLDKNGFGYGEIEKMLRDIEPETILFLSKLKEINIETDTGDALTILKDDHDMPQVQIMLEGTMRGESFSRVDEFLLYSKTFDKPPDVLHEKRNGIDKRDGSIAFPLNKDAKSIGKMFAYLPVRSDTGLPFLINADFILPSSREEIRDIPWNRWLMGCIAELAASTLLRLKERGLLTIDLLEALASRVQEISENSIFYPIVRSVSDAFVDKELLPADDGTFVSARNAKLASAEWLRKLLREEQLRLLYKTELKWISGEVTERGRHDLWKYIREKLEVEEVTPDGLARKVDSAFFEKQTDQWIVDFYRQLLNQKALWKKGSGSYWDSDGPLRQKSFIRLQDGSHVRPFDDDKPNAYLVKQTALDVSLLTVKVEIIKDDEARRFLSDLGIPEFDIVAEVIEHVIPKYTSAPPPKTDEHQQDIEKILEAFKTDSQEKRTSLKRALQEKPFILATAPISDGAVYRRPHELYFQDDTLEMYFAGNFEVGFISSIYQDAVLNMFKDLGVSEDVRVHRRSPDYRGIIIIKDGHGSHERGLRGFDPDIQVEGLECALASLTIEKSRFIWNCIAIPNAECIRGTVERSSRQNYENSSKEERVSQSFGRLLKESEWLPGIDGKFHNPSELSLNDLPEQFESNEKLAEMLGMKKDVVARFAEEVGIPTEDIDLLRKYPEEFSQWKAQMAARIENPEFPTRTVKNLERRQERLTEQLADAPEKEYEECQRSVRTTRGAVEPSLWLREQYTNDAGQMVCQICKEEMPFKKRDGEYYFEAVEALSKDYFSREHEAQFLALCPLCAAMYKELVKKDEEAIADLRNALLNTDLLEVPLRLGDLDRSIRFVESHFSDIRTILRGAE